MLASFYEADLQEISDVLIKFTNSIGVETEEKSVVQQALRDYAEENVDFIDAYIAAHAKANPPELCRHLGQALQTIENPS